MAALLVPFLPLSIVLISSRPPSLVPLSPASASPLPDSCLIQLLTLNTIHDLMPITCVRRGDSRAHFFSEKASPSSSSDSGHEVHQHPRRRRRAYV